MNDKCMNDKRFTNSILSAHLLPLAARAQMQRARRLEKGRPAKEMLCHTLLAVVIRSYQLETFRPGRSAKIYSTNLLR
ncbi:MAG: hypothetical protein QOJ04_1876 [Caballeronia sp.]|jgi:hypothetical protein|nr:hypothetical protein [Caballeronia sp.]